MGRPFGGACRASSGLTEVAAGSADVGYGMIHMSSFFF